MSPQRVLELVESAKASGIDLYTFAFDLMNEERERAATVADENARSDIAVLIRSG